jgi:hypothetical protein
MGPAARARPHYQTAAKQPCGRPRPRPAPEAATYAARRAADVARSRRKVACLDPDVKCWSGSCTVTPTSSKSVPPSIPGNASAKQRDPREQPRRVLWARTSKLIWPSATRFFLGSENATALVLPARDRGVVRRKPSAAVLAHFYICSLSWPTPSDAPAASPGGRRSVRSTDTPGKRCRRAERLCARAEPGARPPASCSRAADRPRRSTARRGEVMARREAASILRRCLKRHAVIDAVYASPIGVMICHSSRSTPRTPSGSLEGRFVSSRW